MKVLRKKKSPQILTQRFTNDAVFFFFFLAQKIKLKMNPQPRWACNARNNPGWLVLTARWYAWNLRTNKQSKKQHLDWNGWFLLCGSHKPTRSPKKQHQNIGIIRKSRLIWRSLYPRTGLSQTDKWVTAWIVKVSCQLTFKVMIQNPIKVTHVIQSATSPRCSYCSVESLFMSWT